MSSIDETRPADDRQGVQSAEVALRLLTHMAAQGGLHSVSDLARGLGWSRATVHRYLVSLQRCGYVEQEMSGSRYGLGAQALQTGLSALADVDFVAFAAARLPMLAESTGHTVFTSVWGQHGPTIVQWRESALPVTVNVRVGSVLPLVRSATGQVYAAWFPEERVLAAAQQEWDACKQDGVPVPGGGSLREHWAHVRQCGYARVSGHYLAGVDSVSVPVFDADGELAGALTSLGLTTTFEVHPDRGPLPVLKDAAAELSRRMGWRGQRAHIPDGEPSGII